MINKKKIKKIIIIKNKQTNKHYGKAAIEHNTESLQSSSHPFMVNIYPFFLALNWTFFKSFPHQNSARISCLLPPQLYAQNIAAS